MALGVADVARRLRELIVALDRRPARREGPGESAIAREAAGLREQAVARLAEISAHPTPAPDEPPDRAEGSGRARPT